MKDINHYLELAEVDLKMRADSGTATAIEIYVDGKIINFKATAQDSLARIVKALSDLNLATADTKFAYKGKELPLKTKLAQLEINSDVVEFEWDKGALPSSPALVLKTGGKKK